MLIRFLFSELLPLLLLSTVLSISWIYQRHEFLLMLVLAVIVLQLLRLQESVNEDARERSVLRSDHRWTVLITKLLLITVVFWIFEVGHRSGRIELSRTMGLVEAEPEKKQDKPVEHVPCVASPKDPANRTDMNSENTSAKILPLPRVTPASENRTSGDRSITPLPIPGEESTEPASVPPGHRSMETIPGGEVNEGQNKLQDDPFIQDLRIEEE